jgi:MFS family permease
LISQIFYRDVRRHSNSALSVANHRISAYRAIAAQKGRRRMRQVVYEQIGDNRAEPPRSSRIYTREFWLIFTATSALNAAGNLFLMFPLLVVDLGGGATTIGEIIGVGSMAALLTRPLASRALERRGHRWTALWTLVIDAVALMLYAPIRSLGVSIYAVRALHGAADGSARVALFALVYEILPLGRQGEAMATFSLSGMGPAAFGALIGEMIMHRFGFGALFFAAGLLCTIGATAVAILPENHHLTPVAQRQAQPQISWGSLISGSPLIGFWIIAALFGNSNAVRSSFVAPFAYQRGIHSVGWYFTIYAIAAVIVRLSGRAMDRIGLERILAPAFITLALGIAMIAGFGHFGVLELAAALGGIGHGFAYPALSALIIRHTPEGATGRSSAIYTSLWDASAMFGPYLFGLTAHLFGYSVMFLCAGLMTSAAALFVSGQPAASSANLLAQRAEPSV